MTQSLGALHRDSFPHPIRQWSEAQEELLFFWNESESRMGLRSNFESMVSAAMGGDPAANHAAQADYGNLELIDDPEASYRAWSERDRYKCATRARLVRRALARMIPHRECAMQPDQARAVLFAVYGPRRNRGLEAWGLLGALAPYTEAASDARRKARARLSARAWCERLSARLLGDSDPANENHRKRPTATEAETILSLRIGGEAAEKVKQALFLYVRARGR